MEPSLTILPATKKQAEEIVVPISFIFRPFDNTSRMNAIPNHNATRCSKCGSFVTRIFHISENKCVCPFCNIPILQASEEQLLFSDFRVEQSSKPICFYVCFVYDMRCSDEFIAIFKIYITMALRALLPGTKVLLLCLFDSFVSFLKIINGKCTFMDIPMDSKVFDLISLDLLLNPNEDIECLIANINKIKPAKEGTSRREFYEIFTPCPQGIFINFVVFSAFGFDAVNIPNMSFDIISPSVFKNMPEVDGFAFSQHEVEDICIQIQALVQRLTPGNFALNMKLSVIASSLVEVTPSSLSISALRSGSSMLFNISLAKTTCLMDGVYIEVMATYDVPISWNQVICRTVISSRKFNVSKNYYRILSTINPLVVFQTGINSKFITDLYEVYNTKICNSIPGAARPDPFFTLIPSLRWLLRFTIFQYKPKYTIFIRDANSDLSMFYPQVSFWDPQFNMIDNNVCAVTFEEQLIGPPPHIIIDSCYKIDLFTDEELVADSEMSNFINTKVQNRFPVPRFAIRPRKQYTSFLPQESEWNKSILALVLS